MYGCKHFLKGCEYEEGIPLNAGSSGSHGFHIQWLQEIATSSTQYNCTTDNKACETTGGKADYATSGKASRKVSVSTPAKR